MKRVLCPSLPRPGHAVELPETEAEHSVRVLRLRDGDTLEAIDGKGYAAKVTLRVKGGPVRVEYLEDPRTLDASTAILPITLEMAILKGDAMEWVIEKAVELGIRTVIPTVTTHTVVQIQNKGPEAFQQRWQKIADQALKQCGRFERLEVALPISLEELLRKHPAKSDTIRIWCDEGDRNETPYLMNWLAEKPADLGGDFRLLIGPEGGWSVQERELLGRTPGFGTHLVRTSLGPLVLRAETAAIFATSLVTGVLRGRLTKSAESGELE